ncbi:MAG TPA: MgtC/SapB family protein [Chitinophagaceae bacterium]|nr:MgtC/SapB family protein [Chitinophagaceae bacterium]
MGTWLSTDIERVLVALLIGAVIGAEREYRSKSAGLRTMILVCTGSCVFTLVSLNLGAPDNIDRIAANIITGIGFIGAGVIFKDANRVTGITTATTIWVVAALGMEAGAGNYLTAFIITAIILVVLIMLIYVQDAIGEVNQLRNYRIVCAYQAETLHKYEALFKKHHLKPLRGRQSKKESLITGNWLVQGAVQNHEALIAELLKDRDIIEFDF